MSTASAPSIASLYNVCIRSFNQLCSLLQAPDCEFSGQISPQALQDELGRFRVWAGNAGAHRKGRVSLDYKLREASQIHGKVVELLKDLDGAMRETIAVVSHERRPLDELSWSSDSSVSSLEDESEIESQGDVNPTTELQERFLQITHVVTCLYKFSITIRNPVPHDRLQKCASIDVSHYEFFDIQHTSHKFPKAKKYLIDRLGEANSRRRQLFKYYEKHHDKLARNIDLPQPVDTLSGLQLNLNQTASDKEGPREITGRDQDTQDRSNTIKCPSTVATTMNTQTTVSTYVQSSSNPNPNTIEECSDDGQSQTSYATSVSEDAANKLRVPPPPKPDSALDGNPFECPYCFSIIAVHSSQRWMKHIFRDLRPYVCTFKNCPKPDRLFHSRQEWYTHEVEVHRKEWFCNACHQPFATQELFEDHLRQNHFDTLMESQLPAVADRCARALESEQACPLCEEICPPQRLQRHIARHMQQLALFALPRMPGDASGDGESVSVQASELNIEGSAATTDLDVTSNASQEIADGKEDERTPRPPESAESLIRRLDEYKLETDFGDDYVVHRTREWKPLSSNRSWETSIWKDVKRVGRGEFGDVWLQEKQEERGNGSRELRVVKGMPRRSLPDAGRSRRLPALVKLDEYHHLFVKFYGWYESQHEIFLVMEYIELGDLRNFSNWTEGEVKEITRQSLEGLEVLHGKKICHLGLKPQNILVACRDPLWVKIADYLVSLRGTILGEVITAPSYCAPEMLGLFPRNLAEGLVLHASDIWSLGLIVHELLTFEIPFISRFFDSNNDLESVFEAELSVDSLIDFAELLAYCRGDIEFPTDALQKSQLGEEGISFVKSLLDADPKERPAATAALQHPWLTEHAYTSNYVEQLKAEFSRLGIQVDLGFKSRKNILVRQLAGVDIMQLLPGPVEISSLVLEALEKGCNLAFLKLFASPSLDPQNIDNLTKGKLFQLAAGSGQLGMAKILFQSRVHIGAQIGGRTVAQWGIESEDVDLVNLYLETTGSGSPDLELFLLAVKSGSVNMVTVFLRKGVDINATIGSSQTALQAAAEGGHTDIVKLLLENKADVNAGPATSDGRTALQAAAERGHMDIVKLLLDNKANVNAGPAIADGRTALQAAAEGGHTDIVKLLLDNKANVNAGPATGRGRTALQAAAEHGHMDTVKLLLDRGADVNAEPATVVGLTALRAAAEGGHTDIVKLLLDNKANVNAGLAADGGRTAFQAAAGCGRMDIVKLLLDCGADVNAEPATNFGRTALQAAAGGGHTDIVELLLDNKANVNAGPATGRGRTALQAAAEHGHMDTVKVLLDRGADVNAKPATTFGRTALQAAAEGGHTDIVKLLLDRGADVNAGPTTGRGRTALQTAAEHGHMDTVKLLLDRGADVNAKPATTFGRTALQAAAECGRMGIVKLLLDRGADVNAEPATNFGRTALQAAAEGGHMDIFMLLLDNKANVNAGPATTNGRTALQAAAECGHMDIVKLLLDRGADVNAELATSGGRTALQAADKGGYTDIVKLLLDNKADVNIKPLTSDG